MLTACPFRSADVLIYKILSRSEWTAARAVGRFEGSAVDLQDGIIGTDKQPLSPWTLTFDTGS